MENKVFDTSHTETDQVSQRIEAMVRAADSQRTHFVRRWYDNNFFDDGYHFRFVDRQTNRIVDLTRKKSFGGPVRAIPKASRQIRGVANLLVSGDPTPVVYPEKLERANYSNDEEFNAVKEQGQLIAKKIGHWLQEEWKDQAIYQNIIQMIILTAKHGVSFMQIWPDKREESIKTKVYDAFDIRLLGNLTDIQDSPFIIKSTPHLISDIRGNSNYDKDQRMKVQPDNKSSQNDMKEAYLSRRYGRDGGTSETSSALVHEAFTKEYINEFARRRIQQFGNADKVLEGKKDGDVVIRHTFSTNGVWLKDEYLEYDKYPFVDFRMEPGPIYQVPLIERFIPSNKSLDQIVSRLEKILHTHTVGIWLKRRGERFDISNQAGGQVVEYDSTPPTQANMAQVPAWVFSVIDLINSFIEEQGVTTSALGKIPGGVKSGKAIESLKESEFANLVIANRQLKETVRQIAQTYTRIAHDFFITPQTVHFMDKGEPSYFDIIGQRGVEAREELNFEVPEGIVPIKKDLKIDIEIQSGLGFTREGQIQRATDLSQFMLQMVQAQAMPPQAMQVFVRQLLEIYQFGSISEIMEAIDENPAEGDLTKEQLDKVKLAVLEVMSDVEKAKGSPQEQQEQRVTEAKVGAAQAIKDIQEAMGGGQAPQGEREEAKPPSRSISFKDLPPEGQAQLARQAGIDITAEQAARQQIQGKGGE